MCSLNSVCIFLFFFFFNDTATTEIYTLSLHDALPICKSSLAIVCGLVTIRQEKMQYGKCTTTPDCLSRQKPCQPYPMPSLGIYGKQHLADIAPCLEIMVCRGSGGKGAGPRNNRANLPLLIEL